MKKNKKQSNLIDDIEIGVYDEQKDIRLLHESQARVAGMTEEEQEELLKLYDEMVKKHKSEHK